MKSSLVVTLLLSLVSYSVAAYDPEDSFCCLCPGCGPMVSGREALFVNDQGYTCTQLTLDLVDSKNNVDPQGTECAQQKSKWRNHCCNAAHTPVEIEQTGGNNGLTRPNDIKDGPYGVCDLCRDWYFPGLPTTVVAVLDHPGIGSCARLFWYSRAGNFEDRNCRPMQNFYKTFCGCNQSQDKRKYVGPPEGYTGDQGSSGNSGTNGGGAPDVDNADDGEGDDECNEPNPDDCPPPKKEPIEDSKSKMHGDEARGNLGRRRTLRGEKASRSKR